MFRLRLFFPSGVAPRPRRPRLDFAERLLTGCQLWPERRSSFQPLTGKMSVSSSFPSVQFVLTQSLHISLSPSECLADTPTAEAQDSRRNTDHSAAF